MRSVKTVSKDSIKKQLVIQRATPARVVLVIQVKDLLDAIRYHLVPSSKIMAKSKSVILVIFVQEKIKIKLPVEQANMLVLKVPYHAWIAYQANTNRMRNKLTASIVKLVELHPMPLEKPIVPFATKVGINRNKA